MKTKKALLFSIMFGIMTLMMFLQVNKGIGETVDRPFPGYHTAYSSIGPYEEVQGHDGGIFYAQPKQYWTIDIVTYELLGHSEEWISLGAYSPYSVDHTEIFEANDFDDVPGQWHVIYKAYYQYKWYNYYTLLYFDAYFTDNGACNWVTYN